MKTAPTPPSELAAVLKLLMPTIRRAWAFALMSGTLVLAGTYYMFEVYGRVLNSRSYMTLAMLTLAVVLAYALMEALEWARSQLMRDAGAWFDQQLAPRLFDAMLELPLRQQRGATVQPIQDLRQLRDFFHNPVLAAAMEAPLSLLFLLILYAIHPWLGWMALIGAGFQIGIAWLTERLTQPPLSAANRTAIAAQQVADGMTRQAEVAEAMGMMRALLSRWARLQSQFLADQALASNRAGVLAAVTKWVQTVWSSALLGLGAFILLMDHLPGGAATMIVGSVLGGRLLAPLVQLVGQWRAVVTTRDCWQRLTQLLQVLPVPRPAMPLPAPRGYLRVEGVVAGPPGSNVPILRGIGFALQPGHALAIVGPSGSGKTTLARVLLGLWPVLSGKVRLDGADIHTWDKRELGPHLGYLPQSVDLLEGSIAENVARFGDVDEARVQRALERVRLWDWVQTLPEGMHTSIGQDGVVLSGGQRQRVALARALYGRPALVVLDEPNAHLDEAGDAALLTAIAQAKAEGTTFVIITHRVGVLQTAEAILVLADGAVQALGPRDQVLAALQRPPGAVPGKPMDQPATVGQAT